jgi:alpha-L-fucosidase
MKLKNTIQILSVATSALTASLPAASLPMAPGPFQPTQESLKQFQCPDWFRDAKFGIWAHWGPQSVPMAGDWYARNMYIEANTRGQYQHHLTHYGHPSTNGWKDIIPLWKAEKFDADRLMRLYQQAGARYFVSMGVHHDNFDLWNSQYHRWNAVQMGPHRDIVGEWRKAAKKQGLPFGVSEHLGASFWWWQVNKGADTNGPLVGVPYDGANPQWQDLYHWPAGPGDTNRWYCSDERWHQLWFQRIKDLVDNYQPDLLYTDGGVPFGEVGRTLIAHLYNADIQRNGALHAVYTCKAGMNKGEFVTGSYVQDMERGVLPGINPLPWQTDTSIGDWFYNANWKTKDTGKMYRSADWVVRTLVDIVSKNGNLLLNVIQRPDGSLDPEVEQLLKGVGSWLKVNGEAIYGTRPWLTFGEGAAVTGGGHFKEDFGFSARDIRFTTNGKTLYAIALGWPEGGKLTTKSLGKPAVGSGNEISRVELVGKRGKLAFTQSSQGLEVTLPEKRLSEIACTLRITGANLQPVNLAAPGGSQ